MSAIETGDLPTKPTKIKGGVKRKTNAYYEKLGRIYAEDMLQAEPHLVGSGFFDSLAKGFRTAGHWINDNVIKPVGHVVGKIVEPVADVASVVMPEFAPEIQLAKKGVKAITKGKGAMNDKHIGSLYGEAIMREHPDINKHQFIQGFHQTWNIPEKEKRKRRGSGRASSRGHLIKTIMKERNVTLPQASRIIKQEGLKY